MSDELVGADGGFLSIRRLHLRNRRADGSLSQPYLCDFVARPSGVDAVVVVVYRRTAAGVDVLMRDGLRPALPLGRGAAVKPAPDRREYLMFREVVAGIIEVDDEGVDGIRRRAAIEVAEEAGFDVTPANVRLLGAPGFPTPGAMPEKFWFAAVEVDPAAEQAPLAGDGSPMEEGARTEWMALDAAIAAGMAGDLEDLKTELALRRLRDDLDASVPT